MITFENTQVVGWEPAIRGMRNPMNSWNKSDSSFEDVFDDRENFRTLYSPGVEIGPADHELMMGLAAGGPVHAKYRRMITVYVDITAPLYWWKEFDTYKVGTVANSCSTMHKIQAKKFEAEDFSREDLDPESAVTLQVVIRTLEDYRRKWIDLNDKLKNDDLDERHRRDFTALQKHYWWQMIKLLPSSYNQKRTVMMNYEVLHNIYVSRKDHKLDEWRECFIDWIKSLPYSEIIIGSEEKENE